MDGLAGGLEGGGATWVAREEKLQAPTRNKIAMKKTIIFLRFMALSPFSSMAGRLLYGFGSSALWRHL
jgi:hypothetical protein